ncbi:MAG: response regulator transcription factor [Roseburia sp.]|nr:response regulator transcription factor [Roseburia sp.]MCM1279484.1 response regulator transcription factor [Robinsoniella sp.]
MESERSPQKLEVYYTEDDKQIAQGIKTYLEAKGFHVTVLETISATKHALLKKQPSIILIDWNLPDGSGDLLCGWIRRRFGDSLPILFLTVKGETEDIVKGFQNGADDYIVKPFELEILYSRMMAILRRAGKDKADKLFCDEICLDREKLQVCHGEREVLLSHMEYQVLQQLMENKGKTVTRKKLLEEIWDSNGNFVNDNTLTVTMKRLREKLGNPACIKTVRSFGYRMEDTL